MWSDPYGCITSASSCDRTLITPLHDIWNWSDRIKKICLLVGGVRIVSKMRRYMKSSHSVFHSEHVIFNSTTEIIFPSSLRYVFDGGRKKPVLQVASMVRCIVHGCSKHLTGIPFSAFFRCHRNKTKCLFYRVSSKTWHTFDIESLLEMKTLCRKENYSSK